MQELEYDLEMTKGVASKNLLQSIPDCKKCPRLRKHCTKIAKLKKRAYLQETYWGKPVPSFGDLSAKLVIVGLAPAAHGANRTGRMFTGDRSGEWLYRALHDFQFANQAQSENRKDGLKLKDTYITAVVRCAPPDNKPTREEISRCQEYLRAEIEILTQVKVFLALGQIALNGLWPVLQEKFSIKKKPKFGHGMMVPLSENHHLLLSYHPSQQNTFTGKLTQKMFDDIFRLARSRVDAERS